MRQDGGSGRRAWLPWDVSGGPGRSAAGAGSPGLQPALSAGGNRPATNAEEEINGGWRRDERKQPSKEHALVLFLVFCFFFFFKFNFIYF